LVRSSETSSPRSQLPLLRFGALQSFMSNEAAGSLGFLLPPRPHCFQRAPRPYFTTGPRSLASSGSSSRVLASSSEYMPFQTHSIPKYRVTSREVLFPIATSVLGVHFPRASQAHFVPSSAFPTLSTVSSSSHLAGLFHPTATSGIHFSGVFLAA